jgi:hypothetical protein
VDLVRRAAAPRHAKLGPDRSRTHVKIVPRLDHGIPARASLLATDLQPGSMQRHVHGARQRSWSQGSCSGKFLVLRCSVRPSRGLIVTASANGGAEIGILTLPNVRESRLRVF